MGATEAHASAAPAAAAGAGTAQPYPPSWLDLALRRLDGLPGPRVAWYAGLSIAIVLLANAALWISDLATFPELNVASSFWGIYTPLLLLTVDHLNGLAGRALDSFVPALDDTSVNVAELRYRLTVTPAWPAAAITVLVAPLPLLYYLFDPRLAQVVGYRPAGLVMRGIVEIASVAVIATLVYQTIRQLSLVMRLHAMAEHIDIFRPGPLYAFSNLTARTGSALILFTAVPVIVSQPALEGSGSWLIWAPWLVGIPLVGAIVFVLPMIGMHQRLAAEKQRLQGEADERLRSLLTEVNADLDSHDLSRADALQKLLEAHLSQRDLLARLPTWPWSPSTVRGFASALLLPVVLFLIQRYLEAALPT